jgi:hypothetical protein
MLARVISQLIAQGFLQKVISHLPVGGLLEQQIVGEPFC